MSFLTHGASPAKRIPARSLPGRAFAFFLMMLALCAASVPLGSRAADSNHPKILIGALLSLTGDWSSLGIASQAALEIAVEEMNTELADEGSPKRVKLIVEDTKLDPELAAQKLRSLAKRGVSIVVGPQSSAELRAIGPLAEKLHVLVVSQGSTASSLATVGDAVFRFCPSDVHEGDAVAALMKADGIQTVVPIWRGDAGNEGLASSTKAAFQRLGGGVAEGVRYSETEQDLAAQIALLAAQVHDAKAQSGASTVGVYLASFDEGITLLALAGNNADLASVRWYGGDGLTQSATLLDNAAASIFAATVHFTTPSFGLDPAAQDLQTSLSTEIQARVGYLPDAFALAAYDAGWVSVLARRDVPKGKKFVHLQNAFIHNADRYWGATGATSLDAAGDRSRGNYDFWRVVSGGSAVQWNAAGAYVNGAIIPPAGD